MADSTNGMIDSMCTHQPGMLSTARRNTSNTCVVGNDEATELITEESDASSRSTPFTSRLLIRTVTNRTLRLLSPANGRTLIWRVQIHSLPRCELPDSGWSATSVEPSAAVETVRTGLLVTPSSSTSRSTAASISPRSTNEWISERIACALV